MLTVCFLLVPLFFIVATIYVGVLLRKWMPKALSVYMGGDNRIILTKIEIYGDKRIVASAESFDK